MSVPHPTWLRTYTDSHALRQGPAMDCETVEIYILVRPLKYSQPQLCNRRGISQASVNFCQIIPHMQDFLCQHPAIAETTVKQRLLAFILFDFQHWRKPGFSSAMFLAWPWLTPASQYHEMKLGMHSLFLILTSFASSCMQVMLINRPCHGPWTVNESMRLLSASLRVSKQNLSIGQKMYVSTLQSYKRTFY